MSMKFEKNLILKELVHLQDIKKAKSWVTSEMFAKDSAKSTKIRKQGNELFAQKNHSGKVHEKIWKLYSQSIATAPNGSEELATGYANRSALLVHLHKYEDCLVDIDRALQITASDSLKVKLFCRQTECFAALQNKMPSKSLSKAKFWLSNIDDDDQSKKALSKMIEKAEKSLKTNTCKVKATEKTHDVLQVPDNLIDTTYNSKMGRGLVASRAFQVGEFICKEKFYAVTCNNKKLYAYCSHCLGISWTAVPCDNCSYYMYCGEKCKEEAWQKYHDIECSLHVTVDTYLEYYNQMSIRSLIRGFKEAGSIQNLRNMVEEIDKSTDDKTKGFTEDGQFLSDSFRSVYSLRSSKSSKHMGTYTRNSLYTLIALVKNTNIFGTNANCSNAKSIMGNSDLLFIGTLLLRLNLILTLNAFHAIDESFTCRKEFDVLSCALNCCCQKGMSFSPFVSLINHSCDANVSKLYTSDGSVVYYALKPIPKGTQLFSSYYYPFHHIEKMRRDDLFQSLFEFKCECIACKNDFPIAEFQSILKSQLKMNNDETIRCNAILAKYKSVMDIAMKKRKYRRFSKKTIDDFTKDVNDILTKIKPVNYPLFSVQVFTDMLQVMMEGSYGCRLHIPKNCNL